MTHSTPAGQERKKVLSQARKIKRVARLAREIEEAREEGLGDLEAKAKEVLRSAEELKLAARIEDLQLWVLEKTRALARGGSKTYRYWYASWREGQKVKNYYLGSLAKVSAESALQKARKMKRQALGIGEKDQFGGSNEMITDNGLEGKE